LDRLADEKRRELSAAAAAGINTSITTSSNEQKSEKNEFKRPNPISSRLSFQNGGKYY
jgi:hypothetical protein